MTYRPDIDGLRAVAVLPVVLFHFGVETMAGGFVGVDVFFVISGYLITGIVVREIEAGRFSLSHFYERRVRRIAPALLTVISVVLLVGTAILLPRDLRDAGQSAVAAVAFAANILFFLEAGYFDAAAYTKPLLHTWSLGIEEQFYIVLPLLMMGLMGFGARVGRASRRTVTIAVTILTALSFLLSALTTSLMPTAAYYLLPWRAWELGVGALLALTSAATFPLRGAAAEAAAALGLGLIAAAVLLLDHGTPFPGTAALMPVLGAALVIAAGRQASPAAGRLLGTAPCVWIGRISYSLYLWHWPVVVAYAYIFLDLPEGPTLVGLLAVSVVLAWASWRFVERPFRVGATAPSRRGLAIMASTGAVVIVVAGLTLDRTEGLPGRLPDEARRLAAFEEDRHPRYRACFYLAERDRTWLDPCIFGAGIDPETGAADEDGPARVALWGDSHAPAWLPAVEAAAERHGIRVALYGHNGCPGVADLEIFWAGQPNTCIPYLSDTFAAIRDDPAVETVILVMRAQMYVGGWIRDGFVERDRTMLRIGSAAGPLAPDADRHEAFLAGLDRTVAALQSAGKAVVLVAPLPEALSDVPGSLVRRALRGDAVDGFSVSRASFDDRSAKVIAGFEALAERRDILLLRPDERLCDDRGCALEIEGVPLFSDANHLTATAARRLSSLFDPIFAAMGPTGTADGT